MTTLQQLEDEHDKQAASIVTKQLNCEKWQINANDVLWLYHDPQVQKQLGRSKRVYNKLINLQK